MYPDVNGNGRIHISGGEGAGGGEIGGTGKPKSVNISLLSRADGKGDIVRCNDELLHTYSLLWPSQ